jgi:RES domain-containing protein
MIVYRHCAQAWSKDLSGYGAEKSGGRWNSPGIAVLYTAASRALAVVEIAVHTPLGIIPLNYFLTSIEFPNDTSITKVEFGDLPKNWNKNPFIKDTQQVGDDFIKKNTHLVLQVPSASVPGDFNYLINPRHPDFKNVRIVKAEPFEFDLSLFKKIR